MALLRSCARLWRTLRHLRMRQVRYQVARRLGLGRAPRPLPLRWSLPEPRLHREKNTRRIFAGPRSFTFNNETRAFAGDWNDPAARKLWLYNLHYMGWLFDLTDEDGGAGAFARREAWIARWIRENPRERGGNGWEPYPLSLRLFNWCKHYALAGIEPSPEVRRSLEAQAGCLYARLEFHLDANHLLENLLAMAFIGFFLDPADGEASRARARVGGLLAEELKDQFLEDGGHYELSPMYHAILLERILDLLNFWPAGEDPFPGLREKLRDAALAGLSWLDAMSVAGRFSLFNDACYDDAPEAGLLLEYGERLLGYRAAGAAPLRSLPASGYYRAESGPLTVIFDAGKLGPDHQMGHAQGDLLSFCLWVGGAAVLVHPGNYEYVQGEMRDYCRSTAAHNTLAPDGAEQAEWWGAHRVGWRARPSGVSAAMEPGSGAVLLRGAHDGYARLPGHPVHRRELRLHDGSLEIRDEMTADPGRRTRVRFHVHPDCAVDAVDGEIRIRTPAGTLRLRADASLRLEEGWYCPEFGLRIRNRVVVMEGFGTAFRAVFSREASPALSAGA